MSAWRRVTRLLTRTVTAGAAMVAIALPAAALSASQASAAGGPTITSVYNENSTFTGFAVPGSQAEIWQNGDEAALIVAGSGFANDGGPVSATTTAPGVTVLEAYEESSTTAIVVVATSEPPAAQPNPGFYSLSLTDDNGTATMANAIGVNAASTITSASPATVAANTNVFVNVTGTLLDAAGTTHLALFNSSGNFIEDLSQTNQSQTSTTVYLNALNEGLTAGTYFLVELGEAGSAGDGGTASNPFPISVTAPSITGVQPTAGLTVDTTQTLTETVIITGSGFLPGATVSLTGNTSNESGITFGTPTVTPTQITVTVTVPPNASLVPGTATVEVVNPGGFTLYSNTGALGIGEPGASPTLSPSLTCSGCDLQFGVAGVLGAAANSFPVTTGTTVNFTSSNGPSFTGTVGAVSGGAVEIDATPPRYATATLTAATAAAATSLPLSSTAGITSGTQLLVVDGSKTEQLKAGTPSGGSVPVPAALFAHASGVTVEWSLPQTTYTMTINNGTLTEGTTILVDANGSSLSNETPNQLDMTGLVNGTIDVQFGGKFSFIADLPGFNFSSSSTAALVDNGTGGAAAGGTATVKALDGDQGLVTVTMPTSVPGTATLTASNDGGCTGGANSTCVYLPSSTNLVNTDGNSGQTNDPTGLPQGDFQAAFLTSSLPAGLAAGSSVTASVTSGPSETFTVGSLTTTQSNGGTAGDTTVLTFTNAATFNVPTNATWTAGVASTTNPQSIDLVLFNGAGQAQYLGFSNNSGFSDQPFLYLDGSLSIASVTDDNTGSAFVGQGASTQLDVVVDDPFFGSNLAGCADWSVSSTDTNLTFGAVDGCEYLGGNNYVLYVPVTVAGNATVNSNVQISVQGGVYGGASTGTTPVFGVVAGPTITSVTTLGTLSVGESGAFTIQGTDLTNASVSIIAGSGENAGGPDYGTYDGQDGAYATDCTTSATQITCTLVVGDGASAGNDSVMVTSADNSGTATSSSSFVTIVAPTASALTPTQIPYGYYGTFTATLAGFGTLSPSEVGNLGCEENIVQPDGNSFFYDGCSLSYASATTVTIQPDDPIDPFLGTGDSVVFTIGNNTQGWVDTPFALITSSAHYTYFGSPIVAGTTETIDLAGANFNPGTQVASNTPGITVNSFTINSPEDATVNFTVAASVANDACYQIQIGSNYDYLDSCLTVIGAPSITSVNGTNVAGSTDGAPYSNLNGAKDTLVIQGSGFTTSATVSASSSLGTFGTAVASDCTTEYFGPYNIYSQDLCSTLTVPVTWTTFTGAVPVVGDLTVTNPTGWGGATAAGEIQLNPAPTVTGTYYVPTFSTNIEYPVTGTGFQKGLTATSSNSAYTVSVANVTNTTVTLLVSTSSAATTGTSSQITFTNPDGGTVTWTLNGGPAPLPALKVSKVYGRPAHIGKTTVFQINGSNLANATVTVSHKGGGVTVSKLSNSNTSIKVRVTVKKGTKVGVAKLHLTNTNGSASVAFSIKK